MAELVEATNSRRQELTAKSNPPPFAPPKVCLFVRSTELAGANVNRYLVNCVWPTRACKEGVACPHTVQVALATDSVGTPASYGKVEGHLMAPMAEKERRKREETCGMVGCGLPSRHARRRAWQGQGKGCR